MTPIEQVSTSNAYTGKVLFKADVAPSTNAQFLQLVTASGLSSVVAMTIFNRGRGAAACSESQWKGFLAEPGSPRYLEMSVELVAHAVHQFARIGVHRELD